MAYATSPLIIWKKIFEEEPDDPGRLVWDVIFEVNGLVYNVDHYERYDNWLQFSERLLGGTQDEVAWQQLVGNETYSFRDYITLECGDPDAELAHLLEDPTTWLMQMLL